MVAFPVSRRKGLRAGKIPEHRVPIVHCTLRLGDYIPGNSGPFEARDRFLIPP
jgi:hypothetical protein